MFYFFQDERVEYIKPIMFSGGIGTIDAQMIKKHSPEVGMQVAKVGGPIYRSVFSLFFSSSLSLFSFIH